MIRIVDVPFLHSLSTASHFLEAVEKSNKKTTPISLETIDIENFYVQ